jgi:hypothetical protein
MPNTGERREITKRVNAKEAEMVQQSKKLVSRTRETTADTDAKNLERTDRNKQNKQAETFPQSVIQPARDGNSNTRNPPAASKS